MTTDKNEPLFNAGAAVYDTFRFLHAPADRTAAHAGLKPGMDVLDVACGSGRTVLAAARTVGRNGRVTGIDIAEKLLEIGRQKADTSGVTTIQFLTGRAESLGFTDGCFDAVTCASSLFLFPDMIAAVRECCRVLKPGGRIVFSTFGSGVFQPVSGMIDAWLREHGFEKTRVPVSARTDTPAKCSDILFASGIVSFEVITENLDISFETAGECWRQTANSLIIRPRLADLSRDQYQALKEEITGELESMVTGSSFNVAVPVLFIKAEKPF